MYTMFLPVLIFITACSSVESDQSFRVVYQWNLIDIEWPSQDAREKALANGDYIPKNNPISGIKLWRDHLYLTIPRWKNGVPVTLTVIPAKPKEKTITSDHGFQNLNTVSPRLQAFPNWQMQTLDDCTAFQFVQSMEIDPMGRMWVIDTGRTATMTSQPKNKCPPRIVILDLENGGAILRCHVFPNEVASYDSVFLNDIVLDHEHGGFAYITDNGDKDPGLIVYSLTSNTSWKVRHSSMKAESEAINLMVNNTFLNISTTLDGIALSPASRYNRMVYYTPLSSFNLYALPTAALKTGVTDVNNFVRKIGRRRSQTDGMVMTSTGTLFFGLLADDAVAFWNTPAQTSDSISEQNPLCELNEEILAMNHTLLQWPDTFAIDEDGYLWCVTNGLQNFVTNKVDTNMANYRVIKFNTRYRSYQYFEDGSAPVLPIIASLETSRSAFDIPVAISLEPINWLNPKSWI